MGRSTITAYKWYSSGRVGLFSWRWSDEDLALLREEYELDEQERVRAAEAIADYKLMQNWDLYNSTLNPPVSNVISMDAAVMRKAVNDFLTRRAVKGTDGVQAMLREFWREKV